MMNIHTRSSALLFLLILVPGLCFAQPRSRDRQLSFDCVVCHVGWHDNIDKAKSLLPEPKAPIQIEGLPAHVPVLDMCVTCHDGTVEDSREVFSSNNHQLKGMDPGKISVRDLPLDKNNQIYCGTCHTPHSLKPDQPGGLAPFMRVDPKNSSLCLNCHSEQAKDHFNHPIHIKVQANHKMPPDTYFGENNTIECMTCHPIHGKQGTIGVTGDDRTELCSACHEDYFSVASTDHDLTQMTKNRSGRIGPSFEDRDVCASCHQSHNGKGEHMWAMDLNQTDGANGYCIGCHSETGLGKSKLYIHSGHKVSGAKIRKNVPALGISINDQILCTSCHDPHQWEFSGKHAVTEANEEGTEYTSFLRLPDDAQGQLCLACHSEKSSIRDSDHSVVREGFQQHFRGESKFRGQCSACHETHGLAGYTGEENVPKGDLARELCESCHSEAHFPTSVGGFDHPLGAALQAGIGLPGYNGTLSCITCHDPHTWGQVREKSPNVDLDGTDANSFLRISNWPEPNLCLSCHGEQKGVRNTDHDLTDDNHSSCSFCHSAHNAQAEYGILRYWVESKGRSYNERFCFACHQEGAIGEKRIPRAWEHPHEYGTVALTERGDGKWIDFPLFSEEKPQENFGFIDCFTCHDPHKWSFNDQIKPSSGNDEGDFMSSFLRNPSSETLCTDCHGIGALWKYNYYHDPVKRKRY
ncbi:MAG: hypothetical protein K9N35_10470 [Candidatus Marinimicrobia bacterium]|nr:hypothetical protein [Candidatus Neomarinimicrobiota bacterium]